MGGRPREVVSGREADARNQGRGPMNSILSPSDRDRTQRGRATDPRRCCMQSFRWKAARERRSREVSGVEGESLEASFLFRFPPPFLSNLRRRAATAGVSLAFPFLVS